MGDGIRGIVGLVLPFLPEGQIKNRFRYRECLALGYLTSSLERAGYQVVSINAELRDLSVAQVVEELLSHAPFLVGLSISSQRGYKAAKELAQAVKAADRDIHITCGGILPSSWSSSILSDSAHIDSVVRGEGEDAIVELADAIRSARPINTVLGLSHRAGASIQENAARHRQMDLSSAPPPARNDLEYIVSTGRTVSSAYMVSSRGCYAKCSFCSIHQIYGDHLVARRKPDDIVEEMRTLQDRFDVHRFSFVDDLFLMPSRAGIRWIHEFCNSLEQANLGIRFYAEIRADTVEPILMRRLISVGLDRIFLGLEAGVDSILARLDKGTTVAQNEKAIVVLRDEVGLRPEDIKCGYIMFEPEMTFAELKDQYRWIRASGICRVQHLQNRLNIYWGTPIFEKMKRRGLTDTAPFAERWFYNFDDHRVAQFEASTRRFLRQMDQAQLLNGTIAAKARFREETLERDQSATPRAVMDVFRDGHTYLEQQERECWYLAFDTFFSILDRNVEITPSDEAALWDDLSQIRRTLVIAAQVVSGIADFLAQCRSVRVGQEQSIALNWRIRPDHAVEVALRTPEVTANVSSLPGFVPRDCFDNSFRIH
ncbi:B12-binding domain-containing radical SAM protein [Mesorhizobium sp. M8A.F.Ca.ET.208.01.1.1]|uniref:B12-binding domain-containing radical SAM protein n=1 Tax=unclassified Mesorhizobium TaxID=325217 RepID=UPI00109392FD|nr:MULTISPECIES: radical SAM protein [unclassified Mesorhizobium]TGQ94971.1 B12-binding domain-containing radical SAM protein [Mesorhizobium sp. M8A.F.Ca.ET.208.01.1.1]TGT55460.1 B12-binding domain-containing radical SAM protein [Mesorhizobium sp. M8A.F.Ca.ET.167.01.1.1]